MNTETVLNYHYNTLQLPPEDSPTENDSKQRLALSNTYGLRRASLLGITYSLDHSNRFETVLQTAQLHFVIFTTNSVPVAVF